ncbi:MAG: hypothetical protein WBG30_06995 [Psychrilyobacter sp.]
MRMQTLENGMNEVSLKGIKAKFYVTTEKDAIEIALKLGGVKC